MSEDGLWSPFGHFSLPGIVWTIQGSEFPWCYTQNGGPTVAQDIATLSARCREADPAGCS